MQKLRELCDGHQQEKPASIAVTDAHIDDKKKEIELDELNSCLNKMDYDVKLHLNWQQICACTDQNAHAKNQEWVLEQADFSNTASEVFYKRHFAAMVINFAAKDQAGAQTISEITTAIVTPMHECQLVCELNWTSFALFHEEYKKVQMQLLTWALGQNAGNLGVLFMPIFTNQKNKLFLIEESVMKKLKTAPFIWDHNFSFMFKDRCDGRDNRPMCYPGRILFPSSLSSDVRKSCWWGCFLRSNGKGKEEARQLEPSAMSKIEDLTDEAVPTSTEYAPDLYSPLQNGPVAFWFV